MNDRTAAVVVIGNEVLAGLVDESNATFLVRELRGLGVRLKRVVVIPDEIDVIAEIVADLSRRFDFVVSTGGIGPTHDDVTMRGVAQAFGRPLVRHEAYARSLERAYGEKISPRVLSMADLPEGSTLIGTEVLRVPAVQVENVLIFPGIPRLLQDKFNAIKECFRCSPFLMHRVVLEIEESRIADHVESVQLRHPRVSIGSYPRFAKTIWEVTLQLESKEIEKLDAALEDLLSGLPQDNITRVERSAP
ncbi:MAG: molybdopterin-binding protein [Planctomycetota bacterium]